MINTLQNTASVTLDLPLTSVKSSPYQLHPVFTHALFFQANSPISSKQPTIRTIHTDSKNSFTQNRKLTKALPDLLIFTNKKNLSINQWLFKMQNKFEIN